MVKVSLIIPIFNLATYVERLVYCLKKQTFTDCEMLIIDDGSSDNSFELLQKFVRECEDGRIKVLSKAHSGVSDTRNVGIERSKGEYIMFADGDDSFASDYISEYVSGIEEDDSDIAFHPFDIVKGGSIKELTKYQTRYEELARDNHYSKRDLLEFLSTGRVGGYPVAYISKKSLWDKVQFDTRFETLEDLHALFNLVMRSSELKVSFFKNGYYSYEVREDSQVHTAGWEGFYDRVSVEIDMKKRINDPKLKKNLSSMIYIEYLNHVFNQMNPDQSREMYVFLRFNFFDVKLSKKQRIKALVAMVYLNVQSKRSKNDQNAR